MINGFNAAAWSSWFCNLEDCEDGDEGCEISRDQLASDREETDNIITWILKTKKFA